MNESRPNTWRWATVGQVAEVSGGLTKNAGKRDASKTRVPLVSVAAVHLRRINTEAVGEVGLLDSDGDRATLARGDILLVEGNGSLEHIGRVALWNDEVPGARHQNHIIRVRPHDLAPRFVLEWLASPAGREAIVAEATSAAGLYTLSLSKVERLPVPLPPPKEQHRIVAKVEALQARSRRAREALDAVPPLLEKLRQSILAAAFRGDLTKDWRAKNKNVEPASELLKRIRIERRKKWEEAELAKMKAKGKTPTDDKWKAKYKEPEPVDATGLPELPKGWCWASVEELAGLITSGSRGWAEYYADSGPLFIRSQDINSDILRLDEVAHVQVPVSAEGARTRVQQADILITITGANVTRCAGVSEEPGEAYVSQHVALVRPIRGITTPFLHLWLVAESGGRKQLKNAAYGLGKPGLNLDDVASVAVPLAPADEQTELVRRAADLVSAATATSMTVKGLFQTLGHLDASVLARAFRGELVPQDPNDEPADAMLTRVREPNGERKISVPGGRVRRKGRTGAGRGESDEVPD